MNIRQNRFKSTGTVVLATMRPHAPTTSEEAKPKRTAKSLISPKFP